MVFIPRWERFRDKKPDSSYELDTSHELSQYVERCFIFADDLFFDIIEQRSYNPTGTITRKFDGARFNGVSKVILNDKKIKPQNEVSILFGVTRERLQNEGIFSDKNDTNWATSEGISFNLRVDGLLFKHGVSETFSIDSSVGVLQNIPMHIASTSKVGGLITLYQDAKTPSAYSKREVVTAQTVSSYYSKIGTYYSEGDPWSLKGTLHYLYKINKELDSAAIQSLYEAPYQILKPRRRFILLPTAAANSAALTGNAAANANSAATFTADIPLSGASTTVSRGNGAVSASVPLSGISSTISGSAANITATVSLTAAAISQALASAGLSLDALLSGGAGNTADGAGSLSANSASGALSGSGATSAKAGGDIVLQATLSGAAISNALANAGLVSGNVISGSAGSKSTAAGALVQDIPLSGSGSAVANGIGNVSAIVPLTASGASAANMTGGLTVSVAMSASALAKSLAQAGISATTGNNLAGSADAAAQSAGSLQLSVPLDAQAVLKAVASGVLTQGVQNIPQIPRWSVNLNSRRYALCV